MILEIKSNNTEMSNFSKWPVFLQILKGKPNILFPKMNCLS